MGGPVDHVGFHARLSPERLAAADLTSGRRWTYADLDRAVGACAAVLRRRHGVRRGDRVASLARNCVEQVLLHLACARTGLIFVPLNWRLSVPEIAAVVDDAEPGVIFGDAELDRMGLAGAPLAELSAAIDAAEPLPTEAVDADAPSLMLFTSGTSGRPKGVLLSEANVEQTAINFGLFGRVTPGSVFLVDAPMFHVIGLVTSVRPALMFGGAFLTSDAFQPPRTLARMADPNLAVTHYFCVPQMAATLRADPAFDPSSLRGMTAIFTGGAPHAPEAIRAWLRDGIPVSDGFGMTEAGTVFGMPLDPALIDAKAGSAGVAPPTVQTRIVDAEARDCPPGAAGELLLRGRGVFSAYWRRPEETAAAFTADGWFRTGDIARCDGEGFHWLVDRRKDMFISGGENVYPAEIENALVGFPGIAECAVIGVPDPQWGEVGICVLAPASVGEPVIEAVQAHLAARLARYKLPRRFVVLEALPRTGSGKVMKSELRRQLVEDMGVRGA
jgi:fatty-acyl-CoA synthase